MQYPENAGYMVAAYVIVAVVVLVYAVTLWLRVRKARQEGKGTQQEYR